MRLYNRIEATGQRPTTAPGDSAMTSKTKPAKTISKGSAAALKAWATRRRNTRAARRTAKTKG